MSRDNGDLTPRPEPERPFEEAFRELMSAYGLDCYVVIAESGETEQSSVAFRGPGFWVLANLTLYAEKVKMEQLAMQMKQDEERRRFRQKLMGH